MVLLSNFLLVGIFLVPRPISTPVILVFGPEITFVDLNWFMKPP